MYTISKDLMSVMKSEQKEYRKEWLGKNSFWYIWTKEHEPKEKWPGFTNRTLVYLLAGKNREITSVIPLVRSNPYNTGCRIMSQVSPVDFAIALSKIPVGSRFLGLARIGAFHTHSKEYAGYTKSELNNINTEIFLSLGRNGILLEKPLSKYSKILKLTLKVV